MPRNERRALLVRLSVGALIVVGLVLMVRVEDLGDVLAGSEPGRLAAGLVCLLTAVILVEAFRFWLLFRRLGVSLRRALSLTLSALFFVNLTGSMLGGEIWRVQRAGSDSGGYVEPAVLLMVLRASGLIALCLVLVPWVVHDPAWFRGALAQLGLAGMDPVRTTIGAAALIAVSLLAAGLAWRRFGHHLAALRSATAWDWIGLLAAGIAVAVLRALSIGYFLAAFGHEVPLIAPLPIVALVTLASVIPLAPANLGVREAVFVLALQPLGVPAAAALAVGIMNRLGLVIGGVLGAPLVLTERRARDGAVS